MSGNPFRRQPPKDRQQLPIDSTPPTPVQLDNAGPDAAEDKGRKPSTSKKVVRIQTPPPLSPDPVTQVSFGDPWIRRLSNEPRAGSPPPVLPVDAPPAAAALKLDPLNPTFGAEVTPQDPQVIANTRRNSEGGASSPPVALAAKVLNPFQKTLANIEPQNDDSQDAAVGGAEDRSGSRPEGQIDVNSFTKMLMTGQGGPTPAEKKKADTSGSTAAPPASVPTNFDDLEDASSEDEGSLAPARSDSIKGAPPPPRHKHGKSITERAPQTVSFNGFEDQVSTAIPPVSSAEESSSKPSSDSDASKRRLPPPRPVSRRPTSGSFEPSTDASQTQPNKTSKPPPPPPTRRGVNRNSVQGELPPASLDTPSSVDESYDSTAAKRSLTPAHEPSSRSSSVSENRTGSGPPPPPTRRRRGSSKSSVENQPAAALRASVEAKKASDDNRRGSQESARRTRPLGQVDEDESKSSRDILADLSAFQAEVDALRQSYRQT